MSNWYFLGILCSLLVFGSCNDDQSTDHCFNHKYNKSVNTTHMQFTKEAIPSEYAVLGDFKSLHCCAKGYRSIEWTKDGKPYPWSSDLSSLILYPEASNQTIYTRQVQLSDVGNYTCVLRNDTHKQTHHITLKVQDNIPDLPLETFAPHDLEVELNYPARFYCEAFVGKVGLPDAKSEITWYQIKDEHEEEVDGHQEVVFRENGQTIGSYLTIPRVEVHNYGRYVCRIQMGNNAHRLELYALLYGKPVKAEYDQSQLYTILAVVCGTLTAIIIVCLWFLVIAPRCFRGTGKEQDTCQSLAGSPNRV